MKIIIIAALTGNRVIGRAGQVPWHDPADLKHFKRTTTGHAVIMGRKTFDSLPKPLPGRRNVVITRKVESRCGRTQPQVGETPSDSRCGGPTVSNPPSAIGATSLDYVSSLSAALALCRARGEEIAFIAGGGQIYLQALPLADEMILTRIDRADVTGDTYFPMWNERDWIIAPSDSEMPPHVVRYLRIPQDGG